MRLRENQSRAKTAKVWIIISMSVSVISIGYIYYLYDFVADAEVYGITETEAQAFIALTLVFGALGLGSFIGSAITFIQWFRRAYFNAHIMFKGLRYSEGWAAGAWFIPIFWWIGPVQIASDFFKKSEARLKNQGVIKGKSKFYVIVWWWVLWVASSLLNQVDDTFGVAPNVEYTFGIISSIASIGSGFFVIRFINIYSKMEQELARLENEESSSVISDNPDLLD